MNHFVRVLRLFALLFLGLHLGADLLPEDQAWGIWPYSMLPPVVGATGVGLAALCLWSEASRRMERWWGRGARAVGLAGLGCRWGYPLLAGLAGLLFWWGRLVHTRWGDAYILTQAIPHPEVRLTYTWQAPFDLFLHAKLWALTNAWWGWEVMQLYQVVSVAAGVTFLVVLGRVVQDLAPSGLEQRFIFGAVASLGMMQLFFGYVENYTLIPVGILLFLWLGVGVLNGRAPLWAASLALALTNAFHPSTLVLWPAALCLLACRWRGSSGGRSLLELALPPLLVGAGVLALMESGGHGLAALLGHDFPGGGDRRWFVPLWETQTRWERYTMFSWPHLLDVLNQQLLTGPFALAMLVLVALFLRRGRADAQERFFMVAGLCYLTLTLVWNPDYGGRRDWDLFAPAALPLTLWAATAVTRRLGEGEALRQTAWIVIPTSLVHLAGWVYSNTRPWSW
ncbi:MAG: hypothetical protein GX605_13990 [Chloroflexi bacterium]|nr:hypothetical protein [Chloroflexota bacterium]